MKVSNHLFEACILAIISKIGLLEKVYGTAHA